MLPINGRCSEVGDRDLAGVEKGAMTLRSLSTRRREQAEDALAAARVAQTEFWISLGDLESCLGVELDSTVDLRDTELDFLLRGND